MQKKLEKFRESNLFKLKGMESTEQDLFALMLCEISKVVGFNKKLKANEDTNLIPYHFSFTELEMCNLFNCSTDNLRKTLEPAAKRLTKREIGTSGKWGFDYFSPIYRVKYERGGKFEMYMGPEIAEMIANSTIINFSEIDLKQFIELKGKHAKRIFKSLNRWKSSTDNENLILSFDELRELLGVDNEYKNKQHFRKYCIEIPMREIVTKLSDNWRPLDKKNKGYELIKTGRAYSHIKFYFKYIPKKKNNPINSVEDINKSEIEYIESMIINNVNPIIIESLVTAYNNLLDIVGQSPSKKVVDHLDELEG
jgi:plasmid replication initiation protein